VTDRLREIGDIVTLTEAQESKLPANALQAKKA
jgi:hypothetical protein